MATFCNGQILIVRIIGVGPANESYIILAIKPFAINALAAFLKYKSLR